MRKNKFEHYQLVNIGLIIYDFLSVYISYFLALLLKFDFQFSKIDIKYLECAKSTLFIVGLFTCIIMYFFKLYSSIWRFASVNELFRGVGVILVTSLFNVSLTLLFFIRMPISYYVIGAIFNYLLCLGIRFSYRFYLIIRRIVNENEKERILLIGVGEAGALLIRDFNDNEKSEEKIVCVIDDNPNKKGRYINRVPIVGNINTLEENIRKYRVDRIIIAIPSASKDVLNPIIKKAKETGKDVKIIPSLYKMSKEEIKASSLKEVEITDLLGRDEIKTNLDEVFKFIKNKVVLVTGAGGSIGSELSRQIAANKPKVLILFDIYENSTYNIQLELKDKYPKLKLITLIGSVRDVNKVNELFKTYKPDMVYHAAAHKHVPLMEDSPNEAIKNNCFGTLNVAMAAIAYETKRFLLISSDKAVNPTNIMGASKRICEMIIQDFNKCINKDTTFKLIELYKDLYDINLKFPKEIKTVFSAVRFGNVLGSNGSVVPIFKEQISKGGPVTVTDPNIVRYFMTIPEAVSLVLQSSVYALGGEIFVLDMGEPVKIYDLAKNMIELSGKTINEIPIIFTGLRPGEKLYEERLMDEEDLRKTDNPLISISKPLDIKTYAFFNSLKNIYKKAINNDENMKYEVSKIVTTYIPKD